MPHSTVAIILYRPAVSASVGTTVSSYTLVTTYASQSRTPQSTSSNTTKSSEVIKSIRSFKMTPSELMPPQ